MTRGKDRRIETVTALFLAAGDARAVTVAVWATLRKHYPDSRAANTPDNVQAAVTASLITLGAIEKALLSEAAAIARGMTETQLAIAINDKLADLRRLNPEWPARLRPANELLSKPALSFRLQCVCEAIRLEQARSNAADIDDHLFETFKGASHGRARRYRGV